MRLVFAVARVDGITTTQTTLHLAWTALRRGLSVRFIEAWDFGLSATGSLDAWCLHFEAAPDSIEAFHRQLITRQGERQRVALSTDDVLLLRMTPVPSAVLSFARVAQAGGVRVYNPPEAISLTGPKSWLASLTDVRRPCTIVTSSLTEAMDFTQAAPNGVVVKPMNAWGGSGATRLEAPTDNAMRSAMRDARSSQNRYAIVQHYLPLAVKGEKRLLWLDGELVGGYLRERGENVFQHNLQRGGTPHPCEITDGDLELSKQLSPHLLHASVWLAGIDVIDDTVLEVNTTNPGGAYYSDKLSGTNVSQRIIAHLTETPRTTPE